MRINGDTKPVLLRAAEIHAQLGESWPRVLEQLGIPADRLTNKPGPCPACGGTDRFFFDNRKRQGDFHCRKCGAGNGFDLLMRKFNWSYDEARERVQDAARLDTHTWSSPRLEKPPATIVASATPRVMRIVKSTCAVSDCSTAVEYLASRHLWPLPAGCALRAHVGVDYFDGGRKIGRYPALVAPVRDFDGELVTAHVTYLQNGKKLATYEPRKLLGPVTGRTGCAVRLADASGDSLGISEGIETALSATALCGVPTWAALNTSLLAKFEPPPGIKRLIIFADRDAAGLEAAGRLMERLQGRVGLELRPPRSPSKDWNDRLIAERAQ